MFHLEMLSMLINEVIYIYPLINRHESVDFLTDMYGTGIA
jgi:hypothetical protein